MKVRITDDFDLEKIADSGQCFRWEKEGWQSYRIIAGRSFYAFPNPVAVASLFKEALDGCRVGYRGKYVMAAARAVDEGTICLEKLYTAGEEDTIHALTSLYGVGEKVASCVSLFGLHHVDAFPVDVWMKRILSQEYPDGYPFERYAPYNGICQQYMFAYSRHQAENRQKLKTMIAPADKGNLQDVKYITHPLLVYNRYVPGKAGGKQGP